jgi:hypothetical protein
MSNPRALIDLTGTFIGPHFVVRRSGRNNDGHAMWILKCPADHLTHRSSGQLGKLQRRGFIPGCPECRTVAEPDPNARMPAPVRPRSCSRCRVSGHTWRNCPERREAVRPKVQICEDCAGLPHRRTRPMCCACGEPYAREPRVTIDDIFLQPTCNRREVM